MVTGKAVKVKICGITNAADARSALESGCDALGFVFYKKSPRYIAPRNAKSILRLLPGSVMRVGVFVNAREKTIRAIDKMCRFDMLQFHGNESVAFCNRFRKKRIIKAFRIKDARSLKGIERYRVFAYLFDTFTASKPGGTGKTFDWRLLRRLATLRRPIFLSGGLNARNVRRAIAVVKPHWVDVSSSLELSVGKKHHGRVRGFIRAAKAQ
ncbi:MAG: phosphoribosylanthranilate isomerase [Candidatus Omnitrophica bacterium]|nr:phosphoribosylanthranilate isomerase [Candidatus Omnitrophota bacterium]